MKVDKNKTVTSRKAKTHDFSFRKREKINSNKGSVDLPFYTLSSARIQKQEDAGKRIGSSVTSSSQTNATPLKNRFSFTSKPKSFGRFDATYRPNNAIPEAGLLEVNMKVYYRFRGGFTSDEKQKYTADFQDLIASTWSGKHNLILNDPSFIPYKCAVKINIETVEKNSEAHFKTTVWKRTKKGFRSNVQGMKATFDADDPTKEQESTNLRTGYFKRVGAFDKNSAEINDPVKADLEEIKSFLSKVPDSILYTDDLDNLISIEYIGRASAKGSRKHNKQLSENRVNTVEAYVNAAFPELNAIVSSDYRGEENTTNNSEFQRVDVGIDLPSTGKPDKTKQITAAHEAGHMFGLGDEYIDERSKHQFEGDQPEIYSLVSKLIGQDAADELKVGKNDSIMSHGMEVKRGHYIPFLGALIKITNNDNWTVE